MEKFIEIKAIAAPLPLINVDTDMIIPKQFLKTIKRTGLGANLFDEMRFTPEGDEIAEFVLNREPYRKAQILVTGDNFGCGSSREHAPWALLDFGFRCVIAPSFADIFYNNCFKNGILPVRLPQAEVDVLMAQAESGEPMLEVSLPDNRITHRGGVISFVLDEAGKNALLNGLDDIALTLKKEGEIAAFEEKAKAETPWV